MRVVVAGAIAWMNVETIQRELEKLPPGSTVIHGDTPGADAIAGQIAAQLGLQVEPMTKQPQDYAQYGAEAWKGLNVRMLESGAELVLVFHPNLEASHGSRHLRDLAAQANIEVRAFAT